MTAKNTSVEAIKMGIVNRGVKGGLIFHSDRGIQYACDEFSEVIVENKILQSISRKANCWDNAVAESFFKTLKAEMVYQRKFMDQQAAKLEVFGYIEGFYNTKRTHSALGCKPPSRSKRCCWIKKDWQHKKVSYFKLKFQFERSYKSYRKI